MMGDDEGGDEEGDMDMDMDMYTKAKLKTSRCIRIKDDEEEIKAFDEEVEER